MTIKSKHRQQKGALGQAQKELASMFQKTEKKANMSSGEQESEIKQKSEAGSWMM